MIISDLADRHFSCPGSPSIPENVAYCLAKQYADPPTQPTLLPAMTE
jgi:hypothetical protein